MKNCEKYLTLNTDPHAYKARTNRIILEQMLYMI